VKHIRSAIFDLETERPSTESVRSRVLSVVADASRPLGFEPRVLFDGPVDTGLDPSVASATVMTLREALSNVARHAHATRAEVELTVEADARLVVTDDGVGIPAEGSRPGSGLRNMEARAKELDGWMDVRAAPGGGTVLEWRVPKG
jgi:signal transduction histidine kinase